MKNINSKKLFFDLLMLLLLALLYLTKLTGILLHEIGGLIIAAFVIIHLVYNYKRIKSMFKNHLLKKYTLQNTINVLLLLLLILVTISGILISKELFPSQNKAPEIWLIIHIGASLVMALLILVHLWLHRTFIVAVIKKNIGNNIKPKVLATSTLSILILGFFVFSFVTSVPELTRIISSGKGIAGEHESGNHNGFGRNKGSK